jgi:hypothetical protein
MAPAKPAKTSKRYFSVDEANRALPLVRRIMSDILECWEVVNELEQRMSVVTRRAPKQRSGDLYDEEVAQSEAELETKRALLQEYIAELRDLGVELKGFDGICDFPSLLNGREVFLCWRVGEPSVAYWHELHTGFWGRKPIQMQATSRSREGRGE